MHPVVADVVSAISYDDADKLVTAREGRFSKLMQKHPPLLVFSSKYWFSRRLVNSFSQISEGEAAFGMALLNASLRLANYNFGTKSFPVGSELKYCIIPLYQAQVHLFDRLVKEQKLEQVVSVHSVDQMQGSECDIAIVSAVRASPEHVSSIGFASDIKRLNVALSRAAAVYVLAQVKGFHSREGWSKLFLKTGRKNLV